MLNWKYIHISPVDDSRLRKSLAAADTNIIRSAEQEYR